MRSGKRTITPRSNMPLFAACAITAFLLACAAPVFAGVRDDLTTLFSPPFPHTGITIDDAGNARLLLTISTEGLLLPSTAREFTEKLRERGIHIYGPTFFGEFSWERAAYDAAVTLIRRSSDLPDTVEVSESVIKTSDRRPIVALTVEENRVLIPLRADFGKVWRRVGIIPDKEPDSVEPKIGRFPGSRLRQVKQEGERTRLYYACKGELGEAVKFFDDSLRRIHKTVLITGDPAAPSSQSEIFGIKTYGRVITLSGHTLIDQRLSTTEVILRRADDPSLAAYVEMETAEY